MTALSRWSILVVGLLTTSLANGQSQFEAEFRAGLGGSDNLQRVGNGDSGDTIATGGFTFAWLQETARAEIELRSEFDYLEYLDDTFSSEWIGGLTALFDFTLIEDRLSWSLEDNFGQLAVSPFEAISPDNRQDLNFLTTGPTLSLLGGSRNELDLDFRYSNIDYEILDSDHERTSGNLRLGRVLNRDNVVSLNLGNERIEFDEEALFPPIDIRLAFLRFERVRSRSRFTLDLGYNEAETGGTEDDGFLARFEWAIEPATTRSLVFSGGSEFSNQADLFRLGQAGAANLTTTAPLVDTNEPFLNNYFSTELSLRRARYETVAGLRWSQEDYKSGLNLDRDIGRAFLNIRRDVTRTLFVGAEGSVEIIDYRYLDQKEDNTAAGLEFGYRITEYLSLSLQYRYFDREVTAPALGVSFTENRGFIVLAHRPRWSR